MNTASRLATAWEKASKTSGFHDPGEMTRFKAEKSRDRFYEIFFRETGLHPANVAGMFNDWNKLPHDEAMGLKKKHNTDNAFCAYMAELIERKAAAYAHNITYTEEGPIPDGSN